MMIGIEFVGRTNSVQWPITLCGLIFMVTYPPSINPLTGTDPCRSHQTCSLVSLYSNSGVSSSVSSPLRVTTRVLAFEQRHGRAMLPLSESKGESLGTTDYVKELIRHQTEIKLPSSSRGTLGSKS